ncbi:BglII/BstYI family type II restriction endonuclease [Lutibacter sp.]|uniref:BglII/BstYI family type II restriction endonuclease n=1 Tax=Lutibacter sp. TaxID=1925666 RepID=UPI001A2AFF4D|nr:BglII/BstYI family type II restriction endonuclease [Lutibacter sp.]MBI9040272.1 hypothetical protein [Lutibacter sp.]
MEYITHSFRHAEVILNEPDFIEQYTEFLNVLDGISEEDIINKHEGYGSEHIEGTPKSISKAINELLKEKFIEKDWNSESGIFQDTEYQGETWRLDFAKQDISIEVAFNHSTVIAWNLIKPVLASELNHVEKAIQTKIGIIITATNEMKSSGGFDGAIGTFEKFLDYLPPLQNLLTVPLLIIGLTSPKTFLVKHEQFAQRKKIGKIVRNNQNELF